MPQDQRTDNTMTTRLEDRQYNGHKTKGQTIKWPQDQRTDNTIVTRLEGRQYNGHNTRGQTIQWPHDQRTDNTMATKKGQRTTVDKTLTRKYRLSNTYTTNRNGCSGIVSKFLLRLWLPCRCSYTNSMISHGRGNEVCSVSTTRGTCPWLFVKSQKMYVCCICLLQIY